MKQQSQTYLAGVLDGTGRIYFDPERRRSTRVVCNVQVPGLAERLQDRYGGSVRDGTYWTLSGTRQVRALLNDWQPHSAREDVGETLVALSVPRTYVRDPAAEADDASAADAMVAHVREHGVACFADLRTAAQTGDWRTRRLLAALCDQGRLVRLRSRIRPEGGTTGYRYILP